MGLYEHNCSLLLSYCLFVGACSCPAVFCLGADPVLLSFLGGGPAPVLLSFWKKPDLHDGLLGFNIQECQTHAILTLGVLLA